MRVQARLHTLRFYFSSFVIRHPDFDQELMKMQVRFARHTDRLMDVVGFYRDGLGLPEIGRFENHDGYDGVFLAVPGTDARNGTPTELPGHAPCVCC
jgi:YycE-like N-terminal domain